MTARREKPLTQAEVRERNRQYQHTRRHKDNNAYARANRRAMQRAAAWVKEHEPGLWKRWMRDELEAERTKASSRYKAVAGCRHDGGVFAVGVTIACTLCGAFLGTESVSEADRDELDIMVDGPRPEG